ncbi:SusD/RagB family nutrient-binding outer membrane lipoprotein [Pedobacter punctiformis]|uniref:SusD/RagB family nutrient-binding outer membrane lipoprotein n=1 Tax=Pedobacter punctiformis TaxID=3004097 RepID=A0ABT4L5T8_9SPHI|nr:SusD/RagB family nutrient-binding outer membrane lipoprotein [Pedobacter sp. HCMS5-2]MCZ4243275.1 SusD/RagB family nutrient-binding outer membrane lipoprotein [Pedobacter sp. HCMS5-2]
MRNISKYIFGLMILSSFYACKKDLDINVNPNTATQASVKTVLPTSLVSTAANIVTYNNSITGAQLAGYYGNGGGVSGWNAIISYNYQSSDGQALWTNTYNTLTDVNYVITNSAGDASLNEFNAAAKVLKAFNFQLLVDVYNDVPYTDANQGTKVLQPKYDKGTDIYKALADLCDDAIAKFKPLTAGTPAFVTADPLFKGDPKKWAAFAQTLKLKLILKGGTKVAFTNKTFDTSVGFLTDDAIVQPGYAKLDGKQNPMWNSWAYSFSGAAVAAGSNYAVTPYIMTFYDKKKINDPARAAVVYKSGISTAVNQLGYQGADAGRGAAPNSWFIGTSATTYSKIGIFKGPDMGQPIMLGAESYFLQAEANVIGLVAGTASTNFQNGITASFAYLYKDNTGANSTGKNAVADVATYLTANATNPLVNWSLATTNDMKIEAIITQKYIAFNQLFGHEAWNEFRRTGYPTMVGTTDKFLTIASTVSEATAANKLPTRILYPLTEYQFNAGNIPSGIDKYTSKIFWAK